MEILVYTENYSEGIEVIKWLSNDDEILFQNWKATTKWFDWNNITVFRWKWHFYRFKSTKELWYKYSFKSLPIIPKNISYIENNNKDLINNAVLLLKNPKFKLLVFAGDASKEWLTILNRIHKISQSKIPIEYIWKESTNKEEIQKLWKKRLKGTDKLISWEIIDGLIKSTLVTDKANWKIWENLSNLYTLYYKLLNKEYISFKIERLVIPILKLIHNREEEINKFNLLKFYKLKVNYIEWFSWYILLNNENSKFNNKQDIINIYSKTVNIKKWKIISIKERKLEHAPPFWINITNIRVSKKLKITTKKIMDILEEIHSEDWTISYPKTESKYITEWDFENIIKIIQFLNENIDKIPKKYFNIINYIINNKFKVSIPIINDKKTIEWHWSLHIKINKWEHSKIKIIELINWEDNKSKIFQKILNNNLGFFLEKSISTNFEIIVKIWKYDFITNNSFISKKWYKILENIKTEPKSEYLNNIIEWDIININEYLIEEWQIEEPVRVNTDNILIYMNYPKKLFETNKEWKNDLFNTTEKAEWIWRVKTNQVTIENMLNEKYIKIENWDFFIEKNWLKLLNIADKQVKNILIITKLEKWLNNISFLNEKIYIDTVENYIDKYITYIVNKKINPEIIKKYEENFENKKQLVDFKSPEWYKLYLKENKKWNYYVSSDDNKWDNWFPLFFSYYDPITKKLIDKNHICNTNKVCPNCNSKMNVFKSPKNQKFYIECSKRKIWKCSFVSLYDINKDNIIKNEVEYLEDLYCEKCKGKLYLRKSSKDWNFYAICEHNNKTKKCDFIKQYDRKNNDFMIPIYMKNARITNLNYKNNKIYENDKTYFTKDWKITIWKNFWWVELNIKIIKELLDSWKTSKIINGFISQKWNTFSARLKLVSNMVKYDF